ncbi:hypothetical protein CRG98_031200 [Punica granatum]|uniref:Uncharacterized protein n=1 Tax=Punica granatum TaxID=22663 RepID=A0A2I0IWM7_PUNGR|nr:hypothetical protein CRG98_031200 [Punica granatum]
MTFNSFFRSRNAYLNTYSFRKQIISSMIKAGRNAGNDKRKRRGKETTMVSVNAISPPRIDVIAGLQALSVNTAMVRRKLGKGRGRVADSLGMEWDSLMVKQTGERQDVAYEMDREITSWREAPSSLTLRFRVLCFHLQKRCSGYRLAITIHWITVYHELRRGTKLRQRRQNVIVAQIQALGIKGKMFAEKRYAEKALMKKTRVL